MLKVQGRELIFLRNMKSIQFSVQHRETRWKLSYAEHIRFLNRFENLILELRGSKSDKQAIHVIAIDHRTSELIAPLHRAPGYN